MSKYMPGPIDSQGNHWQPAPVCNNPICTIHQVHIYDRFGIRYGIHEMTERERAILRTILRKVD